MRLHIQISGLSAITLTINTNYIELGLCLLLLIIILYDIFSWKFTFMKLNIILDSEAIYC